MPPTEFTVSSAFARLDVTLAANVIRPVPANALFVVWITTLPFANAFCNCVTFSTESAAVGVNGVTPVTFAAVAVLMVMLAGSINHVPALPRADFAFTLPNACKLSCELVSINPPLPLPTALASIDPKKPVYSFDHTMTRPPSPLCVALAVMRASVPMTVRFACGAFAAFVPR